MSILCVNVSRQCSKCPKRLETRSIPRVTAVHRRPLKNMKSCRVHVSRQRSKCHQNELKSGRVTAAQQTSQKRVEIMPSPCVTAVQRRPSKKMKSCRVLVSRQCGKCPQRRLEIRSSPCVTAAQQMSQKQVEIMSSPRVTAVHRRPLKNMKSCRVLVSRQCGSMSQTSGNQVESMCHGSAANVPKTS